MREPIKNHEDVRELSFSAQRPEKIQHDRFEGRLRTSREKLHRWRKACTEFLAREATLSQSPDVNLHARPANDLLHDLQSSRSTEVTCEWIIVSECKHLSEHRVIGTFFENEGGAFMMTRQTR